MKPRLVVLILFVVILWVPFLTQLPRVEAISCPPGATDAIIAQEDVDGNNLTDWLLEKEDDGAGHIVELWCLDHRAGTDDETFGVRFGDKWVCMCSFENGHNPWRKIQRNQEFKGLYWENIGPKSSKVNTFLYDAEHDTLTVSSYVNVEIIRDSNGKITGWRVKTVTWWKALWGTYTKLAKTSTGSPTTDFKDLMRAVIWDSDPSCSAELPTIVDELPVNEVYTLNQSALENELIANQILLALFQLISVIAIVVSATFGYICLRKRGSSKK